MAKCAKTSIDRIREATAYLCTNEEHKDMVESLISESIEYDFADELLEFLNLNPGISLKTLLDAETLYWLPIIVVSDEKVDFDAVYEARDRLLDKLSYLHTDEITEVQLWSHLIYPCLQLMLGEEFEEFVDSNPEATFEEIEERVVLLRKHYHETMFEKFGSDFSEDDDEDLELQLNDTVD